jgi:cell wall-associated NlpC family hydrolase
MKPSDKDFERIPLLKGGRTWQGADCAGVTWLWLEREKGFKTPPPAAEARDVEPLLQQAKWKRPSDGLERGDVLFFRRGKRIRHCAVYLGANKILTVHLRPVIVNGFALLERLNFEFAGAIAPEDAEVICEALSSRALGDPWSIAASIAISLLLSAVSYLLTPKPKMGDFRNQAGRYSFQPLQTISNPEIPLPVILGEATVAGNAIFQSPIDKNLAVTTPANQKVTKVVVWCSGSTTMQSIRVNGINGASTFFGTGGPGNGMQAAAQNKTEAWDCSFGGQPHSNWNAYSGDPQIVPTVDVRASYDRFMPVYGLNGVCYTVFRFIDSSKFNTLNTTMQIRGPSMRNFDVNGFVRLTATDGFTGTGSQTQFKLGSPDVDAVTSVTVGATSYTELSESNLVGNVYHINKTKGIITFLTAPAAAAAISVTYSYFQLAWTNNPVSHTVFLLTDKRRGKGWDESRINWPAAVASRDYCDAAVTWASSEGVVSDKRFICSYVMDFRKPIQDHLGEILNTFYGYLVLSEGKVKIMARTTGTSVYSFDESRILMEPEFRSRLLDRSSRANRVRVFYHSDLALNAETEAVRDDPLDQADREPRIGNDGVVEEQLKFQGVVSQSQAERLGEQILRENVGIKWGVEFGTNWQGLPLEPGDIIDVTHSSQPDWAAKLFRIESIGLDERDRPMIAASEYVDSAYI